MSSINFEEDQAKVITKTENIRSLADQVERLENLNQEIEKAEKDLKQKKKNHEHLSGEVIPTMMSEMGLSHLKLMDGSSVDVKKHRSISKRALKSLNKDKPFLGFIFRIIYLPTRICDFISDIIWWNKYCKCCKEVDILKKELESYE